MIVKTYNNLWKIEKKMYRIGDKSLERPPTYRQLFFFGIGLLATCVVLSIIKQLNMDMLLVKYGLVPYAICKSLDSIKFQGKRPDRYFTSMVRYFFMPKLVNRYRPISKKSKYRYIGKINNIEVV